MTAVPSANVGQASFPRRPFRTATQQDSVVWDGRDIAAIKPNYKASAKPAGKITFSVAG
jgi:hypothetical protein